MTEMRETDLRFDVTTEGPHVTMRIIHEPSGLSASASGGSQYQCRQAATTALRLLVHALPGPEPLCSACGVKESESEYGSLVDVRVITAEGEGAYGDVTQLLCHADLERILAGLHALGFKYHRHGDIDFLEDDECPGSGHVIGGVCPSPVPEDFDVYAKSYVVGQPL